MLTAEEAREMSWVELCRTAKTATGEDAEVIAKEFRRRELPGRRMEE